MKKLTALFLALVMVVALAAVGMPTAAADAVHLKLNHPAADGGPYDLMAKEFARLVEEKSEGRYVIDIFPANQLGTQEEALDAVSLGPLDMCVTSDDILAKYAPEWGYIGLPFLFDDVDDVDPDDFVQWVMKDDDIADIIYDRLHELARAVIINSGWVYTIEDKLRDALKSLGWEC